MVMVLKHGFRFRYVWRFTSLVLLYRTFGNGTFSPDFCTATMLHMHSLEQQRVVETSSLRLPDGMVQEKMVPCPPKMLSRDP